MIDPLAVIFVPGSADRRARIRHQLSLSALVVSLTSGGPEFSWWLDGRWIPLLLPSVGLGAATVAFLRFSQRANRLRATAPWVELEPGEV